MRETSWGKCTLSGGFVTKSTYMAGPMHCPIDLSEFKDGTTDVGFDLKGFWVGLDKGLGMSIFKRSFKQSQT